MFRRLTASLLAARPSARRRPRTGVRLSVENLSERVVPAAYTWTGGSMANQNWSTLENWSWNEPGNVTNPPDSNDDVTFDASAPVGKRSPVMERDFTIKTLNVPAIAGGDYTLTFNARLDVLGYGTSTFAAGTLTEVGTGRIVFGPSDGSVFNWEGGRISTRVDVLAGTEFHLKGEGTKELQGVINNYSVSSDWDSKGTFLLSSLTVGQFNIKPGAIFSVGGTGDATVNIVLGSTFSNEGTVSSNLPEGKVFGFPAPGRAVNFGTWNVLGGKAATRNFQNSGTINISAGCRFEMGSGAGIVGQTYIDSTQAESGASAIQGAGKAVFTTGSKVILSGTSNSVRNVDDFAAKTEGNGNLSITGIYNVGTLANPGATEWTGAGTTRVVKLPDGTGGSLLIYANFDLSRPLVNDRAMLWLASTVPGGPPGFARISMMQGGSILNNQGGLFSITPAGNTWMLMTGGANEVLVNLGRVETYGDGNTQIDINVPYVPCLVFPGPFGSLKRFSGKLELNKKQVGHVGTIENAPGDGLAFNDGIDMTGGEIINNGELEVINEFDLTGGTVTSLGDGVNPASVLIDTLTQSGGEIDNNAVWTVTDRFTLSAGSFTSEHAGVEAVQVAVGELYQSGGTVLSKAPWTIDDHFALSAGSFTQAGDYGTTAPMDAGSFTQTGGAFAFTAANSSSPFDVAGDYLFQGGSAAVAEPLGGLAGALGRLVVSAPNISFRGKFGVPAGIAVLPGGDLTVRQAEVVAGVVVDGTLHVAESVALTGNLTNRGTVYLSLPVGINPMDGLTITGNYGQIGTATLVMDIAGMGSGSGGSDWMTVSGSASLAGTLMIRNPPPSSYSGSFTLIRYGSRSGMFSGVSSPPGGPALTAWYDNPIGNAMGVRTAMGYPGP